MKKDDWFASWFDTVYYHILYKHRDHEEAKNFIIHLAEFLSIKKGEKALDLACGKGRHSITLNELGLDVLGVDLSENSIEYATDFTKEGLRFMVHDMREPIDGEKFDYIFNLFTSFGYFEDTKDNERVIKSAAKMLVPNGILVIDFMNIVKVIDSLVPSETKLIDGIEFKIKREFSGKHIVKHIEFDDEGQHYSFSERVQGLQLNDFERLLTPHGFKIIRTFGDFDLNPFQREHSDRLIIVAQKTQ